MDKPSIKTINEVVIPSSVTETGENTFNEEIFINNILNDKIKNINKSYLNVGDDIITINEYNTEKLKKYVIITCKGLIDSSNDNLINLLQKYTLIDILIINFTNVKYDDEYGIDNTDNKSAFANIDINELYFYGPKTENIENEIKSEMYVANKIFKLNNKFIKKRYNDIMWNEIYFRNNNDPFKTYGRRDDPNMGE